MEGWLAYHAAFVAAALYRCGTDPVRLAADRATLTLMCRAITAPKRPRGSFRERRAADCPRQSAPIVATRTVRQPCASGPARYSER
jgi:hypothetical protein